MGPWILAGLCILFGAIFTVAGYLILASAKRKRATWIAVQGSVVSLAERQDHNRENDEEDRDGGRLYAPVYRYVLNGKEHSATSEVWSGRPRHQVGDSIPLLVNPENAYDSVVNDPSVFTMAYVMMAVGIPILASGLLLAGLAATGAITFG